MFENEKYVYIKPIFIFTCIFLIIVNYVRITRGIDLTDEMQYYGQIQGLIDSGVLFSNDLFIQQTVYILLYPFFYIYHEIFGYEGFVFFGRLIMAVLSFGVLLYSIKKLLDFKFAPIVACITALSLTFAIPYHGVFAPSYNTISQILWVIFALKFFEWKPNGATSLALLPVLMAFAHPTSAVAITLLIFVRLLFERDYKSFCRVSVVILASAIFVIPVVLNFASFQDYFVSLSFSKGYGVGSAFFSSHKQMKNLIIVFLLFGMSFFIGQRFNKIKIVIPLIFFIAASFIIFKADSFQWGYSPRALRSLSFLSVIAYIWILSNVSKCDTRFSLRVNWLVIAILMYATTIGVTSGNGVGQSTGAFMVGLPLFLAIAVSAQSDHPVTASKNYVRLNGTCLILVTVLFFAHWCYFPYREVAWWRADVSMQSVPEFRFISTSQERADFIHRMQLDLEAVTKGRRTLLVGGFPGLYFALGAKPETCMLYMHSLTSDISENNLLDCLSRKNPEVIVDLFQDKTIDIEKSRIKHVMHDFYSQRGFSCEIETIFFDKISKNNPKIVTYYLCK